MSNGYGSKDFGKELKQMLESAKGILGLLKIAIPIVVVIWLLSGIYTVGPGEVGIVRRFGRFTAQTGPGLRYRLPRPIESHNVVNIAGIRRAEVGFRTVERPGREPKIHRVLEEEMMLTGDRNIAGVQILIQYQVVDPVKYLFRAREPEIALRVNTEVALRSIIGNMDIDHAMTEGRPEIEAGVWSFLQRLLDGHQTGLHVVLVELQVVDPPDEVKESFHDVVRAKADEERLIREAEGYALDVVPRARGKASKITQAATAYREERVALAEGDAARFLQLLKEYQRAPGVTRERLYLETIERVLTESKKFIIDPEVGGNILQFLPLTDIELEKGVGK